MWKIRLMLLRKDYPRWSTDGSVLSLSSMIFVFPASEKKKKKGYFSTIFVFNIIAFVKLKCTNLSLISWKILTSKMSNKTLKIKLNLKNKIKP